MITIYCKTIPKVEYQVKWLRFPSTENTWEPIQNLTSCIRMVDEFELAQAHVIIGLKKIDSVYAMKFKDGSIQMLSFEEVKKKWPELIEDFYIERTIFTMQNQTDNVRNLSSNLVFIDDNPMIRIIGTYLSYFFHFYYIFITSIILFCSFFSN